MSKPPRIISNKKAEAKGGSGMEATTTHAGSWKRKGLTATGGVALALAFASVVWACTLQVGTLTVCNLPTPTLAASCGSKTGTGTQTGSPKMQSGDSAAELAIAGRDFNVLRHYSVLLRRPGSTANCHSHNPPTVVSLIGTKPNGTPMTLVGPHFSAAAQVAATAANGYTPGSQALICVQDEPDRVTGNQINVQVV